VLGADSKVVQCDSCGAWIHVKCEGVSDEVYSKLNAVLGDLSNLAYYCESNNRINKIKQLLYACFIDKKLEATQIQFFKDEECLSKHISISNIYRQGIKTFCDFCYSVYGYIITQSKIYFY